MRRTQHPLAARRGVRHEAQMESAVRYLRSLGITPFQVDVWEYRGILLQGRRPDAAVKLKRLYGGMMRHGC